MKLIKYLDDHPKALVVGAIGLVMGAACVGVLVVSLAYFFIHGTFT